MLGGGGKGGILKLVWSFILFATVGFYVRRSSSVVRKIEGRKGEGFFGDDSSGILIRNLVEMGFLLLLVRF